jgi:pyrroline-5-carboxylate reductase
MIAGSANLAKKVKDSPESLGRKVTSPGGVTQSAIEEFEINNLKNLIKKSMKVAEKKSIELGEG